ncbi:MAG: hypothetical protein HYX75_22440 [Acidobacteria bacterium]|nr:hypothetical protein [Acidobacteriota bacterium]
MTGLTLDGIDWAARTIRVRRPKTGTETRLPLLDPIARALARYLRHHRPAHARDRTLFVTHRMPHARLGGASALKHRLGMYAEWASVRADSLDTHVLPHYSGLRSMPGEAGMD